MTDVIQRSLTDEVNRLTFLVESLQREKNRLTEQLKRYQPKGRSSQVARLFMPKSKW